MSTVRDRLVEIMNVVLAKHVVEGYKTGVILAPTLDDYAEAIEAEMVDGEMDCSTDCPKYHDECTIGVVCPTIKGFIVEGE